MSLLNNKKRIINALLNKTEREIIVDGNAKIMLSCPHTVVHYRNDLEKLDEPDTLFIANYLHKRFDLPYIYKIKSDGEDVNFDMKSRYKDITIEYIKSHNVKLLLDLHQLHWSRKEIVNFGINGFSNINSTAYLNQFVRNFSKNNIGIISIDEPFAASKVKTISNYVHSITNIDCIQIELNCKMFKNSDKYKNVLKCFRETIGSILLEEENE